MKKRSWIKFLVLMFFIGVFIFVYSIYQMGIPQVLNKMKLGNYNLVFSGMSFNSDESGLLKNNFSYVKNYAASEVNRIEVEVNSDDIHIASIDGDEIIIEYYGQFSGVGNMKAPEIEVTEEGGTLSVEVQYTSGFSFFSEFEATFNVLIPKKYSGAIIGKTTSGDLLVSDVAVEELKWDTTSGDFRHDDFKVQRLDGSSFQTVRKDLDIHTLEIRTISGDIDIFGALPQMKIETTSGDIRFQGNTFKGDIDIDTVSGNIDFVGPYDSCVIEFKTISGNRSVKASNMKILKEEEDYFEAKIGEGDVNIKVSSTSGNLTYN